MSLPHAPPTHGSGLATPAGAGGAAPAAADFAGRELYSTAATSEQYVALPAALLARFPGRYVAVVAPAAPPDGADGGADGDDAGVGQGGGAAAAYAVGARDAVRLSLQVATPPVAAALAAGDAAVMRDLAARCCGGGDGGSGGSGSGASGNASGSGDGGGSFCREVLPAALAPGRPPGADLCRLPPTVCTDDGRIRQLSLAGAGLRCDGGGGGLPPSFSNLTALQTLDLAFNSIGGTAAQLGAVLGRMPALQRAFLRYTGITGALDCALLGQQGGGLQLLSLSGNELTGSLPACFLSVRPLARAWGRYSSALPGRGEGAEPTTAPTPQHSAPATAHNKTKQRQPHDNSTRPSRSSTSRTPRCRARCPTRRLPAARPAACACSTRSASAPRGRRARRRSRARCRAASSRRRRRSPTSTSAATRSGAAYRRCRPRCGAST